jgi:hypothetical protein
MDFATGRYNVDAVTIRLYREPDWILNMSVGGQRHSDVVVVRAAPLTYPDHYVCFLDANGREICMVEDPSGLDTGSRQILREELDRRYLTSEIQRIHSARREAGACYVDAGTSRGRREFVVQETPETIRWLGDHRLLLVDVDGNRFEVHDIRALDRKSVRLLQSTV